MAVGSRITFADPGTVATPSQPGPAQPGAFSDEQRVLLDVLRLVERTPGPGILSSVERAYVEAAKVIFDELARASREMLERKVTNSIGAGSEPMEKPVSVGSPNIASASAPGHGPDLSGNSVSAASPKFAAASGIARDTLTASREAAVGVQPAGAAGSLTDRLARLEARLDQLCHVIGQEARPKSR